MKKPKPILWSDRKMPKSIKTPHWAHGVEQIKWASILILSILSSVATAQTLPVKWTATGSFTNPVITITQDANNLVIQIGTLQKAVAKTAFTKLTSPPVTVHDTAWRVLDPKQSADYQNLAAQLADAIDENTALNNRLTAQIQHDYIVSVALHKAERKVDSLKAVMDKDTVIQVIFKKSEIAIEFRAKKQ